MHAARLLMTAAFAAGALCVSAAAHAQESQASNPPAFALPGSTRLAPSLAPFDIVMPRFDAETADAAAPQQTAETDDFHRPTLIDDRGSASALPWYERFTLAPSATRSVWGAPSEQFRLQAGDRWGVTLGYTETGRGPQSVDLQDFSAGAFIEFSDRFRFGGEVRFTSPEEEIFGEEGEERTPEIRFESAFRF